MDEHMLEQMHGGALTSLCITFTVVAVIMAVFALVTLILFYFLAHLGWTVLSNNFALVIVTVLNGLLGKTSSCVCISCRAFRPRTTAYFLFHSACKVFSFNIKQILFFQIVMPEVITFLIGRCISKCLRIYDVKQLLVKGLVIYFKY